MISYGLAVVFIILSLIIGTTLGLFIGALCNAAGNADDRMGRD
jgi:ABC-type dipeptide/oligopeptide/nickel transport system permease subunit